MEILPEELNDTILEEIRDYDTLYIIIQLNHKYHDNYIDKLKLKLSWLNEIKKRNYPQYVKNLFSGLKNISELPALPYQDRFCGQTGYIDKIKICDIPSPIMTGIDNTNKFFITFKLKIKILDIESGDTEFIMVYHERYYYYYNWIFTSINNSVFHYNIFSKFPSEENLQDLKKIINGETIKNNNCEIRLS